MIHAWWVWVCAGLVLGILEIVVPGYIFLGFALGAVLVGACLWLGWLGGVGLAGLLVLFALISLAGFALLRAAMGVRRGQVKVWDRDIND